MVSLFSLFSLWLYSLNYLHVGHQTVLFGNWNTILVYHRHIRAYYQWKCTFHLLMNIILCTGSTFTLLLCGHFSINSQYAFRPFLLIPSFPFLIHFQQAQAPTDLCMGVHAFYHFCYTKLIVMASTAVHRLCCVQTIVCMFYVLLFFVSCLCGLPCVLPYPLTIQRSSHWMHIHVISHG